MSTSNPNTSTYSDCVTSLRTSLSFLESSVATLGNGVADFPRLISVLKTVRVRPPFPSYFLLPAQAPPFQNEPTNRRPPPALRTHPPAHPSSRRVLPPRRHSPLHRRPPRPRRPPAGAPGAPHRDPQGALGPHRRPPVRRHRHGGAVACDVRVRVRGGAGPRG